MTMGLQWCFRVFVDTVVENRQRTCLPRYIRSRHRCSCYTGVNIPRINNHLKKYATYLSTLRNSRSTSITSLPAHQLFAEIEGEPRYHRDCKTSPSLVVTIKHPSFASLGALEYSEWTFETGVICTRSSSLCTLIMAGSEMVGENVSADSIVYMQQV